MSEKRVKDRKKRHMPCELDIGGRKHSGLVLDLSPSGLFIQTNARTQPGKTFDLRLSTGIGDPIALVVEVVRRKVVPPRLLALAQGGVGVRIQKAPSEYRQLLDKLGISCEAKERYRVRVQQLSGSRSRIIEIDGKDQAEAEETALQELGEGWKVLDATVI